MLVIGSAQKYLGATRDPDGSLTITQQLTQESLILGFQSELVGLPTAHNSPLVLVSTVEQCYHSQSSPASNSLQILVYNPLAVCRRESCVAGTSEFR
jgi:hypothetical protein